MLTSVPPCRFNEKLNKQIQCNNQLFAIPSQAKQFLKSILAVRVGVMQAGGYRSIPLLGRVWRQLIGHIEVCDHFDA